MISGVLLISTRGENLISRYFRDDIARSTVETFRTQVIAAKKANESVPIVNYDNTSFLYCRQNDVYLVACTKKNANAPLIFQFLYRMIEIFRAYFGGRFDEETVRKHYVVVYELFDECMDYGYPQVTAVNLLQSYIKHGEAKGDGTVAGEPGTSESGITSEITGNVDWRTAGKYKYRKNEVFIDVLEAVNLLMSSKGQVLRSDVSGKVICKSYLSGMPECKFGLNDKLVMDKEKRNAARRASGGIAIDDVTFHRCVKLGQFEHDRTINFIPPDGEFKLMEYRITNNVNLPFRVIPVIVEHGKSRVEYEIKIKGNFSSRLFASHVTVKIPTPPNTARCSFEPAFGRAKYNANDKAIIWKMKRFPGDASFVLRAEAKLLHVMDDKPWSRPPILMEFQVPMFTSSGLHVRFLKVFERSNYETIKWVRYMTRAGQYQIRI
jgi:AP-2 complex subunit mu-1